MNTLFSIFAYTYIVKLLRFYSKLPSSSTFHSSNTLPLSLLHTAQHTHTYKCSRLVTLYMVWPDFSLSPVTVLKWIRRNFIGNGRNIETETYRKKRNRTGRKKTTYRTEKEKRKNVFDNQLRRSKYKRVGWLNNTH